MYTPLHGVKIFHREISNDGKEGRMDKRKERKGKIRECGVWIWLK